MHGFHECGELGRVGGFKEDVDCAAATETVGDFCRVVEESGVALEGGAFADKPLCFADDFGLEAAAGDRSGVCAVGCDEETGAGAAVA